MNSAFLVIQHIISAISSNLIFYFLVLVFAEWTLRILTNFLVAYSFGNKAADVYDGDLTFLGVIHHELSHAILALLTGAEITGMRLYIPRWTRNRSENPSCLGYVYFATRGIQPLTLIQRLATGFAPALLGTATCVFCSAYIWHEWKSVGWMIFKEPLIWLTAYAILSISHHACPSGPDMKAAGISLAVAFTICILFPMSAELSADIQHATMILLIFVTLPVVPFMIAATIKFTAKIIGGKIARKSKEEIS